MPAPSPDRRGLSRAARRRLWGGAALLLLTPLVAMAFIPAINWGFEDVAIAAAMLLIAGAAIEATAWAATSPRVRAVAGLSIAAAFVLIWAHLAVGLF